MEPPDFINGKHIRLRPALAADKRRIYTALARSELTDGLLGRPSWNYTPLLTYEQFCADYQSYFFDNSHPELGRCFVIEADGRPIGQVNYNEIDSAKKRVELDIWMFAQAHCGRGYGTEALELLCTYLGSCCDINEIFLQPSASNQRAVRAYEKVGFKRTLLSQAAAIAEYGEMDSIDNVYMVMNIDRNH